MSIDYLLVIAERRLVQLELARRNSEQTGDLDAVMSLDVQIIETQTTIAKLKTLVN
jgi:hypothetical protein